LLFAARGYDHDSYRKEVRVRGIVLVPPTATYPDISDGLGAGPVGRTAWWWMRGNFQQLGTIMKFGSL